MTMKKIIIPLFLLLAAAATALYAMNNDAETPVSGIISVHFIDVGQGDAILIDDGTTEILIDGGDKSSGVADYLDEYVDGNLEIMIATHAHADHIGGLGSVLEKYTVEQIWYDGYSYSSKTFTDFISAGEAENAEIHIAKRGDVISIGELSLTVLNPDSTSDDLNNNSIVLAFSYGRWNFLFTETRNEYESSMLLSPVISVSYIEILKVGHHGSRNSFFGGILSALNAGGRYLYAERQSYGHQHSETSKRS
jgi:competence protein ComEC